MPKRRAHGEGALYKQPYRLKDGKEAIRWIAEIELPPGPNGERRRWRRSFRTRDEGRTALQVELAKLREGLPIVVEKQTVAQFLEQWLEQVVRPNRSANTYTSYKRNIELHLLPIVGHLELTKLTPQHVEQTLAHLRDCGRSPRTVQLNRAILRRALNQAMAWRQVGYNAAALTTPPMVRKPQIAPLSLVQARKLLEAAHGHRLEALVAVTLAVGLRESEVLGLRWQDVDLDAATLHVRMQVQPVDGKLQLVPLKTEASSATIGLPAFAVEALRRHRARQTETRLRAGARWQDHDLVFPSSVGTPQSRHNLFRAYKRLLADAGLPLTVRFHDLRHTTATLLRQSGVDLKTVQETLRHSKLSTTSDLYLHFLADVQRQAAAAMDRLFGGFPQDSHKIEKPSAE